jgi:hypothetical protein
MRFWADRSAGPAHAGSNYAILPIRSQPRPSGARPPDRDSGTAPPLRHTRPPIGRHRAQSGPGYRMARAHPWETGLARSSQRRDARDVNIATGTVELRRACRAETVRAERKGNSASESPILAMEASCRCQRSDTRPGHVLRCSACVQFARHRASVLGVVEPSRIAIRGWP